MIHLACNDHQGARRVHKEGENLISGYSEYDGAGVLDSVMKANESGSQEAFEQATKATYFRN